MLCPASQYFFFSIQVLVTVPQICGQDFNFVAFVSVSP